MLQNYSTTTSQNLIHLEEQIRVKLVSTCFTLAPEVDSKLRKYFVRLYKNTRRKTIERPTKPCSHYEIAGRAQKELCDYLEAIRLNQPAKAKHELSDLIQTLALLESQSEHLVNI